MDITHSDGLFRMTWSLTKSRKPMWRLDIEHHEERKSLQIQRRKRMMSVAWKVNFPFASIGDSLLGQDCFRPNTLRRTCPHMLVQKVQVLQTFQRSLINKKIHTRQNQSQKLCRKVPGKSAQGRENKQPASVAPTSQERWHHVDLLRTSKKCMDE